MLGELILVRHGKAEDRDFGKSDFERELTKEGVEEFEKFTQTLRPLLKDKNNSKVWTSPLMRAKQTATILVDTLQCGKAEEKSFIAEGNLDELLNQLRKEEKNFTIICVGHEPYTSMWAKELGGVEIPFAKGAAASIVFDDLNSEKGRVDWKLSPKSN